MWNVARFISGFDQKDKPKKIESSDEWIISELNKIIKECSSCYENYDFNGVAKLIRNFVWDTYASNYLEMVKKRAYDKDPSALYALHETFKKILLVLAPIIPVITEKVWKELYGKTSIHLDEYPKTGETKMSEYTSKILEFNSKVWTIKKERNMSMKDGLKIEIPKELESFKKDLVLMHNITP